MQQLEELVKFVLEHGLDAKAFEEALAKVAPIPPQDALVVWLQALTKNPDLVLVRLQLAKLLWQLDCAPFALEQLNILNSMIDDKHNSALKELIIRLGGNIKDKKDQSGADAEAVKTLATLDFDIEVLDDDK